MTDAQTSLTIEEAPRGFQIRGRFYPEPIGEKLGDPAIIREATGLKWDDYQAAFGIPDPSLEPDEQEPAEVDEGLILAGMVALAVAHANTGWNRSRVVAFVTQLDAADVELIGFDVAPAAVDPEDAKLPPTSESEELSPEHEPTTTATGEPTPDETVEPSPEPQD